MKNMYEYTAISIAQTVPILVVASGDASTDRIASRKSPFIGAFFCLKIEYEFGGPCAMHHKVAEHDVSCPAIAPSSQRLGSAHQMNQTVIARIV